MPDDLPIYSDSPLRTGLQFANLAQLRLSDPVRAWEKADEFIARMEGASNVAGARAVIELPAEAASDVEVFTRAHGVLFQGRDGAGVLRAVARLPLYRGQDCAPPEFIARSLDNFFHWMTAESFSQIHPIERTGLALTRIVDIWPFEFGNLTMAVVFSNVFLKQAGLAPFHVRPENMAEFEAVVAKAMTIETQPLINAIYGTVKREMERDAAQ